MNRRIIQAMAIPCLLVAACSDTLDRERLEISHLDKRVGSISTLKSIDGIVQENEIQNAPGDSKGNNAPSTESIEKIIGSRITCE